MKKIELTDEIKIIFDTLNNAGYECFMVGGCVRDFLLNKTPHDIDFTTNATPEEMKKCFKDFEVIETGIKHGTLTVLVNYIPYEITTYRVDGEYLDNRRPQSVKFVKDIKNDLARRDFTINAMAYNPNVGLVDCFDGMNDLKSGIIRCVNEPMQRLNEDALRILRALRFSAVLGYDIEDETRKACFALAHLLKNISAERVTVELFKTVTQPSAYKIIFDYIDIWGVVIPEMLKMKGFNQYNPHHVHDVLKHTCVALDGAVKDLIVCLTVLFHDIGKPDSFSMDENGNGHFYGHAEKSVEITKNIFNRLKIDNDTKHQVLTLIKYHDLDLQPTERYVRRLCYKLGDLDMVKKLILVQRADNYGQAPIHDERIDKFNQIDEIIKKLESENLSFSLKDLAVDGNDIINIGLTGKQVGESLKYLLEAVLNEQVANRKQDLLDYL
ncbi:MAG: HD domain-containing protein, partial [Clostridia bacterium]|nr:HD domain-containing protein [Clostridia bacterium]